MTDYRAILRQIVADERYQANIDWGAPRPGHPEGTVRAHIAELEANLEALRSRVSDQGYWKLQILIHTHDTFKVAAEHDVAIAHPRSHASLARQFLASFCDDDQLLAMVQYHDEPVALWRQYRNRGQFDQERFQQLLERIADWDLFSLFLIIDGSTPGKSRQPLRWFFDLLPGHLGLKVTPDDLR